MISYLQIQSFFVFLQIFENYTIGRYQLIYGQCAELPKYVAAVKTSPSSLLKWPHVVGFY